MAKKVPAKQAEPDGTASPALESRAPEAWAAEIFPPSEKGRQHRDLYLHGAAAALHGWLLHEHHQGAPMALTRDDYCAALEAARRVSGNTYAPHPAALSPHVART